MKQLQRLQWTACLAALLTLPAMAQDQNMAPGQASLVREVRHELLLLPYLGVFDNLEFRIDGSTLTLLGQVTRPTLKSDAERAVKHIEGIQQVNNQIEVLPLSPMDDQLRFALYRAIYGFPSLQRYSYSSIAPIRIIVKNGHVTLEGIVDSKADSDTANIRANSVPNVFSVTNYLQVGNSDTLQHHHDHKH